ncbi:hypothetical protein [Ferruginivarius sediminum]|nr:hypothetical protein [Ferruginivarius sediminum]
MLNDENNNPRKIFGRVEWPIGLLFATVPVLIIVAIVKNAGAVF